MKLIDKDNPLEVMEDNLRACYTAYLEAVLKGLNAECKRHTDAGIDGIVDVQLCCGSCREEEQNHVG